MFAQWLDNTFYGFDRFILEIMHSLAESCGVFLTPLMNLISLFGKSGIFFIVLSVVLIVFRKTRKMGICMLLSIGVGALITNVTIKPLVERARPYVATNEFANWWKLVGGVVEKEFSFPSGHTTVTMSAMMALCVTGGKKYILPTVMATMLMGISRNYLMVHYPTDVIAAVMVGLIAGFAAYWLTEIAYKKISFLGARD